MKLVFYIILFFVFILLLISCDNYEVTEKQADSFLKFYGYGLDDIGLRVIATEEGYLIMGNIENAGRGKDICIIQTDKFGNTIKPVITHGGLFEDNGYAIKPHDDGYIIVGSTRETEISDKDIYILQITVSGEFVWDTIYGRSRDDEAYDVLVLENGNLVITGYSDSTETRKKDILFLETSSKGGFIKWDFPGASEDDEAFAIVKSGNEYMLAGYRNKPDNLSLQMARNIIVMRYSGEGTPNVNPFDNAFPAGTNSQVQSIIAASINEYYLACNVRESQTNNTSVAIIKIDTTLFNVLWQKKYGEQSVNIASDFSIKDNCLYLCGTSSNAEEKGDLWVFKAGIDGEDPQYYYFGDGISYIGKGFDRTSDGGYVITGSNSTGENSVITLCKLNADGKIQ